MLEAGHSKMNRRLLSGHEVEEVNRETVIAMDVDIYKHGLVRLLPEGWLYTATVPNFLDNIYTMKFKADDVLVVGFAKTGTTWMQEILWTMIHNTSFDNPKAGEPIWLRSPHIGLDKVFDLKVIDSSAIEGYNKTFEELCPGKRKEDGIFLQLAEVAPSPRILKTNFALSLHSPDILDKAKVVYVARNPKDVIVSLFRMWEYMNVCVSKGNMEEYCKAFIQDRTAHSPYWPHVKEAWGKRHHPNMHFVFYEDLKTNIMLELGKLNEFLGTQLTRQKLEEIEQYTSFSAMKSRGVPVINKILSKNQDCYASFYRKGIVGDWKNNFSPELQKEIDQWIRKNLEGTDLSLTWAQGY